MPRTKAGGKAPATKAGLHLKDMVFTPFGKSTNIHAARGRTAKGQKAARPFWDVWRVSRPLRAVFLFKDFTDMRKEQKFQAECYQWLHNSYPHFRRFFYSMANESASKAEAMKRKAVGTVVAKGIADFHIDVPAGGFHGLKIEFKTAKGRLSAEQYEYAEACSALGYAYEVIKPPLSNFIEKVDTYLGQVGESRLQALKTLYYENLPAARNRAKKKRR